MQFFRCGYPNAVSAWPGWRAVVTPLAPPSASATAAGARPAAAELAPLEAQRFWVDLPSAGAPEAFRGAAARAPAAGADAVWAPGRVAADGAASGAPAPGGVGYRHAFAQVFEAFEQRLPREGVLELVARGAVQPVRIGEGWRGRCALPLLSPRHRAPSPRPVQVAVWLCRDDDRHLNCNQTTPNYDQQTPLTTTTNNNHHHQQPTNHRQGKYAYDCPGDRLLDVSWHRTANDDAGPLASWLMRPSLRGAVEVRVRVGWRRGRGGAFCFCFFVVVFGCCPGLFFCCAKCRNKTERKPNHDQTRTPTPPPKKHTPHATRPQTTPQTPPGRPLGRRPLRPPPAARAARRADLLDVTPGAQRLLCLEPQQRGAAVLPSVPHARRRRAGAAVRVALLALLLALCWRFAGALRRFLTAGRFFAGGGVLF